MREPEAAEYLGVSPRTLYRYRKAGKLAYREQKGKARPTVEYEEADLNRLRRELEERRTTSKKPGPATPPRPRLTFGLSQREWTELAEEAARYGLKPPEYARRLVREGLESRFQTDVRELRQELDTARSEVKRLRSETAGALEAVLEYVGLSAEEAKEWVTQNLR